MIRLRRSQAVAGLTTGRITAFSDGVFSIAITLLVLNLCVPTVPGELLDQLGKQWPSLLSYILSFVIVGIYWVAHHNMFHYIKRSDRPFLWINILLLMCVAFIPFPAGLLGQFSFIGQSDAQPAVVVCHEQPSPGRSRHRPALCTHSEQKKHDGAGSLPGFDRSLVSKPTGKPDRLFSFSFVLHLPEPHRSPPDAYITYQRGA